MGIVSLQLLAASILSLTLLFDNKTRGHIQAHEEFLWSAVAVTLIVMTPLFLFQLLRSMPTYNLISLGLYSSAMVYALAIFVTYFETHVLLQSLLLSLFISVGLTAWTFQQDRNIAGQYPFLFAFISVLVMSFIFRGVFPSSDVWSTVWAALAATVYSFLMIYDLYLLMKRLVPEEFVFASLSVSLLDLPNLLLDVLAMSTRATRAS
eukprot:TRINITY_DN3886_c0_g1_i1.p1 TRINITY_DN3886_c0_g1~~TRINITY_DN3886_c0_g1_i1.p1  ORF type:complete len:207 (+),score=32.78 TRINITY_DN3886_c0_g1_i1:227-847(+)